jgi:hypothetical protein
MTPYRRKLRVKMSTARGASRGALKLSTQTSTKSAEQKSYCEDGSDSTESLLTLSEVGSITPFRTIHHMNVKINFNSI